MSAPEIREDELQAFVDGRLPEHRCTAVLAHLGYHPEELQRLAQYAQHKDEIRRRRGEATAEASHPILRPVLVAAGIGVPIALGRFEVEPGIAASAKIASGKPIRRPTSVSDMRKDSRICGTSGGTPSSGERGRTSVPANPPTDQGCST